MTESSENEIDMHSKVDEVSPASCRVRAQRGVAGTRGVEVSARRKSSDISNASSGIPDISATEGKSTSIGEEVLDVLAIVTQARVVPGEARLPFFWAARARVVLCRVTWGQQLLPKQGFRYNQVTSHISNCLNPCFLISGGHDVRKYKCI